MIPAIRARIEALVAIAAEHGAPVSVDDVLQLLPYRAFATAIEFEQFLQDDPVLKARVSVADHVLRRNGRPERIGSRAELARTTSRRIGIAQNFVDRLTAACPWVIVAAVSGSTVYGNSQPDDDLDFFLVVARRRMWITLLVALLIGRVDRKSGRSPTYCFNRTLEDYECIRDLNAQREPLVAREALTMIVLRGDRYYGSILSAAPWMARYFPLLYDARKAPDVKTADPEPTRRGGPHWGLLNAVAFIGVAAYVIMMGLARNFRLGHERRFEAQFRTIIRPGFCAYESNKYERLREIYWEVVR